MKHETQERVDAMLATIESDHESTDEDFDMAEALFVFAHDCGEYELMTRLRHIPFIPHPRLATGEDRGLTEEGLDIYRELLQMEGLDAT